MKKLYLFTALLLFLFPSLSLSLPARAEESTRYAVADSRDVWFYAEANEESGLFVLPYTYYVVVLDEGAEFSRVRYLDDISPYKSVVGYCKTDSITFVDFVPERPFLRMEFTLTYSLPSLPAVSMGNGSFESITKSFVYYGSSYLGTTRFHYVYADGVFDYIPAAEEVSYELNEDYLSVETGAPGNAETPEVRDTPSVLQIVLVCLVVAVIGFTVFILLRGRKAPVAEPEAEF